MDLASFREIVDGNNINMIKSKYCPHCEKETVLIENIRNDVHYVPMSENELKDELGKRWEKLSDKDKKDNKITNKDEFIGLFFEDIKKKNVSPKDWGNTVRKLDENEKKIYNDIIMQKEDVNKIKMWDLYDDDPKRRAVANVLLKLYEPSGVPAFTTCDFHGIISNKITSCVSTGFKPEKQLRAIVRGDKKDG
jgi:hypothetical protein